MRTSLQFLRDWSDPRFFSIENNDSGTSLIKSAVVGCPDRTSTESNAGITHKSEFATLCETEPSLPIFSRDWWLDATVGTANWDVALVKKDGRIIGAMPYTFNQRFGMRAIKQPALTMSLGPWLMPHQGKSGTKLANEKKVMQSLIEQLPAFDYFLQNWHSSMTNWLPFYWNGFHQTTKYTYVIPQLGATESIWNGFETSTRASCKKASERFKLTVRDDLPLETFIALHRMTLDRRGIASEYSDEYIRRLDAACVKQHCRKFFIALDQDGRPYAGNYVVWDKNSAYGLMNGVDPALRNTGAASLCMWEAIKHAAQVTRKFDFFGSMNETIEPFVRSFGAIQEPYFSISKTPSRLLRLRRGVQSVLNQKYAT